MHIQAKVSFDQHSSGCHVLIPFAFVTLTRIWGSALMVCGIATFRAYKVAVRPFYLGKILQAVIIISESVIEFYGIHTYEYFSLYRATKVAIISE